MFIIFITSERTKNTQRKFTDTYNIYYKLLEKKSILKI